ncbi:sensor histidine kinase [Labrys wisconsinensis]|uniref:histidine kinase n=1 Tax=Labrys wisconsinensis TaxID=425677 RepID=A0ABU0JFY5_9HYPH|nr:sensor histidine kinase [Labrys wisconsinensis]MDQ0472318.1 two-component system sensor histidine kinase TctE [Labrys wisconsinensis]
MAPRSLRRELLAWLVVPLAAVVCFNVWTTYENASATAGLITDRTLLASARVIAERIRQSDGALEAPIPPSALEMFASDEPDRVIYHVTAPDGTLIAGYPDVMAPPQPPKGLEPVYFDAVFRDQPIRAVAIAQPIIGAGRPGSALVAVGQTLRAHDKLVTGLWLKALRDQVLLVAAAGLLAAFGLRRGLAPVMRLREAVVERDPTELKPFATDKVQAELRPLVEALNEAFDRVQRLIATQRRFVANAAHQLRTPLALLKTQANVGLREADPRAKDEALAAVDASVDQMAHLSNQLLFLARAEQGSASLRKAEVDFGATTREALEGLAQMALTRDIDLGFEAAAEPFRLWGHSTLLRELVVNLVDNALRYTPAGGMVTASLRRAGGDVVLTIEDSGPGIPLADRERVFERFYRRPDAGSEGTGLGLAIVREIVSSHEGQVQLGDRTPPPGLLVEVRLPAHGPPAAPAA